MRIGLQNWAVAGLALLLLSIASPSNAVNPDEILNDPALEARARSISANLRCLVCQNQSIDDSDAPLARDLRLLVRDRLTSGDSDEAVVDFVVERYGEFVLLRPRFGPHTLALWLGPVILILVGCAAVYFVLRNKPDHSAAPLSTAEERRLKSLLDE